MSRRRQPWARGVAPGERLAFVWLAAALLSCDGPGNTGQEVPDASLSLAVPWVDGVLPVVEGGSPVIPAVPLFPPIASGLPDPGPSRAANCAPLTGIRTSPGWVDTFEPAQTMGVVGVASAWSGFDDLTKYAFHTPGDAQWYPGLVADSPPWGLPAVNVGGPSCDGTPNNWSLHFRGGEFRYWGGGMSHVFTDPDGAVNGACMLGPDLCPPPPAAGATEDSAGLPLAPAGGKTWADGPGSHLFVDASAYEGIAFWARRGPEGQDRLLVTITDNFTSDRLARENQKYCRRLRACYTHCLNGTACSPTTDMTASPPSTIYRCFDPTNGPLPSVANISLLEVLYPRCGQSACTFSSNYPDPDFEGKDCRPYTFPAGDITGEYCYNAGDPPPPDRDEQCLDGWATTVQLTPDWQYNTVPFSKMEQGGFGKKAPYFNVKAIDTIAFGFILGWADVFIDNVSFYRHSQ